MLPPDKGSPSVSNDHAWENRMRDGASPIRDHPMCKSSSSKACRLWRLQFGDEGSLHECVLENAPPGMEHLPQCGHLRNAKVLQEGVSRKNFFDGPCAVMVLLDDQAKREFLLSQIDVELKRAMFLPSLLRLLSCSR